MTKLSKNLSVKEFIHSDTATRKGIDNSISEEHLFAAKLTAEKLFQPIREYFDCPIFVSSGYRSKALNDAIGGSSTSQHCKAEALDLDQDFRNTGVSNADVFNFIKDNLEFDQLIWEFGTDENPSWVHVSRTERYPNRKEILIAYKDEQNRTRYRLWK